MRLAAACGLPVAPVEARVVGGRPYVLVTRYDRRLEPDGHVSRLHQAYIFPVRRSASFP